MPLEAHPVRPLVIAMFSCSILILEVSETNHGQLAGAQSDMNVDKLYLTHYDYGICESVGADLGVG